MSVERRKDFIFKASLLVQISHSKGIFFIPYEFHRTTNRQQELFANGRTVPGKKVTNCDGIIKISNHQIWEALDGIVIKDGKWMWKRIPEYEELGLIAKMIDLEWGGDWDSDGVVDRTDFDIFHFQLGD